MASEITARRLSSSRRHWSREIKYREVDPSTTGTATSTVTPTPAVSGAESSSNHPVVAPLPTSVKALTGFIVVLGVLVLGEYIPTRRHSKNNSLFGTGIAAWRIGTWRRKKIRARHAAASSKILAGLSTFEKSSTIDISSNRRTLDEKSGYTAPIIPAIYPIEFPALPVPAHSPNKAVKKGTNRFIGNFAFSSSKTSPIPEEPSPASTPLSSEPTPRPPSKGNGKANLQVEVPIRPVVASNTLSADTGVAPSPIPSPRTSSHGAYAPDSAWKTPATSRPKSRSFNSKRLPRLMVVTCTFVPSLADELAIKVGETLRLVEEYEDEWCLVQRIGKLDAEKGVIPRFCLQERPEIVASLPKHKKNMSHSNLRY